MVEYWCLQRKLQAESDKNGLFSPSSETFLKQCHELFFNKTFKGEYINLNFQNVSSIGVTQSAFTCSKLTIETLEQGVKYVEN